MRYFFFTVLLLLPVQLSAQHSSFMRSGKIVFERSVNKYTTVENFVRETSVLPANDIYNYMQAFRAGTSQFWTSYFELRFDSVHTLYQPQDPDLKYPGDLYVPVAYKNKVLNNIISRESFMVRQAFDRTFYVRDTMRHIRWKLTEEIREIAGYQCRRANALIADSIYVIAWYADDILTKGGPESFNGLPGMILGVAIPHEHITIFAQQVQEETIATLTLPEQTRDDVLTYANVLAQMKKMLAQFRLNYSWMNFFIAM